MSELAEICEMYEKHGWNLSRVLFSSEHLPPHFKGTEAKTCRSDIDALWFTRANPTGLTWEIRQLGKTPYALCARIEEGTTAEDLEAVLSSLEDKIRNR